MSIADDKLRAIREILNNPTYKIDSGLYQKLEVALHKLSLDELRSLATIISLKNKDSG